MDFSYNFLNSDHVLRFSTVMANKLGCSEIPVTEHDFSKTLLRSCSKGSILAMFPIKAENTMQ